MKKLKTKFPSINRLLFPGILLLLLFGLRYFAVSPKYTDGQKVRITAKVSQEPVRYDFKQKLDLFNLKIYLPLYPEINYGDKVVVEGIIQKGELVSPKLVSLTPNQGILFRFRQKIIAFYRESLPEPHSSLLAGIILGSKSEIPASFWATLKGVGLTHVVVASGMNVTFVAGFMLAFLALFLSRKWSLVISLLAIWGYCALCGFDSPVIRASLMLSLTFLGQWLGRAGSAWRILGITALVMLFVNPLWLTDTGFLLTFAATASLMLFQKKVTRLFSLVPTFLGFLKEGIITSLAAQIGVAPILWATFGQFSLLSPLVNALVLWTVPLIMIIGSLGGLIGLIFPSLGRLVLYLSYPLTWWFVNLASLFSF